MPIFLLFWDRRHYLNELNSLQSTHSTHEPPRVRNLDLPGHHAEGCDFRLPGLVPKRRSRVQLGRFNPNCSCRLAKIWDVSKEVIASTKHVSTLYKCAATHVMFSRLRRVYCTIPARRCPSDLLLLVAGFRADGRARNHANSLLGCFLHCHFSTIVSKARHHRHTLHITLLLEVTAANQTTGNIACVPLIASKRIQAREYPSLDITSPSLAATYSREDQRRCNSSAPCRPWLIFDVLPVKARKLWTVSTHERPVKLLT